MTAPTQPGQSLPQGAIDTHFHVFGPESRYPYAPGRSYTPPDSAFGTWQAAAGAIGVAGGVLVQASPHGFDNSQISDALRAATMPLRAVGAVRPDATDRTLADMDALGYRGARVNTVFASGTGLDMARQLAPRLQGTGWHLEFLSDVSRIEDLRGFVRGLGLPVVFAHFGHVAADRALSDPGFHALLDLVRDGLAWVKLSGPARITTRDVPPYDDVIPLAQALCAANPQRLLWGSDWPHTSIPRRSPAMTELAGMAWDWLGDPDLARQVLVANPQALYGLPSTT